MRKPEPADFGLTKQQIEDLEDTKWPPGCSFLLLYVPVAAGGFLVAMCLPSALDPLRWILLIAFLPPFGPGITWLLMSWYKRSRPEHRRVLAYREVERQYHAWEMEQRRQAVAWWRKLKGRALEAEVATLYEKMGVSVRKTGGAGDEGVDLLLVSEGRKTVVQCKGLATQVGPSIIRDLYGTMLHHGADKGTIVCPVGFTAGARRFAHGKNVELIDAHRLVAMKQSAASYL